MATLANILNRITLARADAESLPRFTAREHHGLELRAIPNEDVFFFVKTIDNTAVVREADPRAGRACWSMIGTAIAVAVLLVGLLLPSLYGLLAGYQLEALRQERQKLENERSALDLAEAKLLSPERLIELARKQQMVDPAPQAVVYLEGRPEGTLARR